MLKLHCIFAISLMSIATAVFALDPRTPTSQYAHRAWHLEEGLPQSTLQAIAQTPDGYLWIGTQDGIARFDGVTFKTFDNELWIRHPFIFSLAVDRHGMLWAGGSGDHPLFTVHDGVFTDVSGVRALGVHDVFALASASDGSIWMATNAGVIHRHDNGAMERWTEKDGLPSTASRSIFIDRSGRVWAGTERGLARIDATGVVAAGAELGVPQRAVRSIYEDSRGRLWIGTTEGVYCASGCKAVTLPQLADISTAFVSSILEDANHILWFGTNAGLKRLTDEGVASLDDKHLTARFVLSLFEDRQHTLWAGTFNGLDQLRDTPFRAWTREQGLQDDGVFTISKGVDGSTWFGTFGGLGRLQPDGALKWYTRKDGLANETVIGITPSRDGGVWVGTYGGGVCRAGAGPMRCIGTADGLPHGVVTSIIENEDRSIWVGTLGGGIAHIEFTPKRKITSYGTSAGLRSLRVVTLTRARNGGLWVGMVLGGAALFRDGQVERIVSINGKAANVRTIFEDEDGGLWLGSDDEGLVYVKDGRTTMFPPGRFLPQGGVTWIVEHNGFLWISTRNAVTRFSKDELLRYVRRETRVLHPARFSTADGLRSCEFSTGQPSAIAAPDGTMWFNGKRGAAELPAGALERRSVSRPVALIEDAIANGVAFRAGASATNSRRARVSFNFTAIDFNAPDQLRFRYKLEGYDRGWIDAGSARAAEYMNLPPGDYTFRVTASGTDGVWNDNGSAAFPFTRQPEFFETWTFKLASVAVVLLLALLVYTARIRLLRSREEELVRRVNESTRELRYAKNFAESIAVKHADLSHKQELILDNAGEGIFGLDVNGVTTFINPAAARMLGSTVSDLVHESIHEFVHGTDAAPVASCGVCSAFLDPPARVAKTTTFVQRSGNAIPVEYTANAIVSESGERTGVVVTFRDITERQSIERMKSEFVSTVSHELRTPLTSIRGALGLLGGGLLAGTSPRVQRMLDIAVNNTDRLVRLINDILDVERIESGKVELNRKLVDAADLMLQASDGMMAIADRAGVALVVEPIHVTLWVDADRVLQVVTNLLGNAIKFSPRGSTVTFNAIVKKDQFIFRVADRGRGVPPDKLETIFERFKQVDASDSRDKGGTGLGLAICRSLANAHGGRIWAESELGNGSVFQFAVPLDVLVAPGVEETSDVRTVLVCEEDRQMMGRLRDILRGQGYCVIAAESRDDIVARAASAHPDVVLLDLVAEDGATLIDALHANDMTSDIPIVVAANSTASVEQYAHHIAAWVKKPYVEQEVAEALSAAIGAPLALIVEDDADLARVMGTAIESHGIRTMYAADGRAAIDLCKHVTPDVVILDVILPEMDGFDVVSCLKQHRELRRVPLVVYSALELGAAQQERLRLGPTAFLTKSRASIDDFDRQVMRFLDLMTETSDAA
jgi:PAS domain S-box-containing protein